MSSSADATAIAIVGGGLGGLALAVGLHRHGVNFHIYEAAPAFSEIGAGVAFGPNATRALGLIHPGLLEGYKRHAAYNEDADRDSTFLSMRWGVDERREGGKTAGDLMWHLDDVWHPHGARQLGVRTRSCIHRARLLDELVGLLPAGVASFGKSLERIDELADGGLRLGFADGTAVLASAVVGCDGIKSKVRDFVCGAPVEPTYAGEYAYRAMVPREAAVEALGPELACNGQLFCGYGAYVVTYPVEQGAFTNMAFIPHERGDPWPSQSPEPTAASTAGDFARCFEGWTLPHMQLFQRYGLRQRWALYHLPHAAPYYRRRVCLLGDSAHATTPHLGAGAGMAMEDAYILSNLIAAVHVTAAADMERAFRAFDAVRRPRTQQLVENSRLAGLASALMMPGVQDNVGALQHTLEAFYGWLWHEDLEAQLATAITNATP